MSAQGHEGPYSVGWGVCRAWPPTPTHHGQQRLGAAQDYGAAPPGGRPASPPPSLQPQARLQSG